MSALLALVGPTGVGKTALALSLARSAPIELVSMDSVQIYRGLDLGSAKPTAEERAELRHHLIDIAGPNERYSAARWLALAGAAIDDVHARGKIPIVCGGTGLYLRALTTGLADLPDADDALRAQLSADEQETPGTLHARLQSIDPDSATRIAPRDQLRLIRALEVHALTGRRLSDHLHRHAATRSDRSIETFVLDLPIAEHERALERRTSQMIAAGLVEEARALRARYGDVPPLQSVGYKEALEDDLTNLQARIVLASRQFSRRQRTWFKKAPNARTFADAASARDALIAALRQ